MADADIFVVPALERSDLKIRATSPWCGRDYYFFRVAGTSFAVDRLYPVKIRLIRRSGVIDVAGGIGADGRYRSPNAGTGRGWLFFLRRDANLVAAFDDEIALVVRVVGPGKMNGVSFRISGSRSGRLAGAWNVATGLAPAPVTRAGDATGRNGVARQ